MPSPFFFQSVGGECNESTDGVSYRQRPPTVGENLFETCFGFCVNEKIYNNRLVLDFASIRGIICLNLGLVVKE